MNSQPVFLLYLCISLGLVLDLTKSVKFIICPSGLFLIVVKKPNLYILEEFVLKVFKHF